MPTGAAAAQAAQNKTSAKARDDSDRGPGSVSGNLTDDPGLTFTNSGRPVSNIRVATTERIQDPKTGEWKDGDTAFYDITCWGPLAENVAQHLQKGDRIVAEGRWTHVAWDDNDGNRREKVYLTARDLGPSMMFRGARPERRTDRQS